MYDFRHRINKGHGIFPVITLITNLLASSNILKPDK